MNAGYGIHWFRRDLRVAGNPALLWNLKEHQGRVLGVFCFDHRFLARTDFSAARFLFFLETLKELQSELRSSGGDLLFLDVGPDEAFARTFAGLEKTKLGRPAAVSFNRDYEPFALDRDARLTAWFEREGRARVHAERDHVLLEPREVLKDDLKNPYYVVYSPYRRRWLEEFKGSDVQARILSSARQADLFSLRWPSELQRDGLLEQYLSKTRTRVTIPMPAAGSRAGLEKLRGFKQRIGDYATARDIPSVAGTSQLSIYLKNGALTVAQVIAELGLSRDPESKFLSELVWREFYYSVLANFPRVESEPFQAKYRALAWENREDWFEAWKQGRTGYPIVDAAMRQLNQTGWMHNRARMIVASFLTKDLLIDYRWGERYFMEKLLDGDLAPNNGGWQWAASTGVDPQPYFRIFNPVLQGQRFDPEGSYVRRWVPELATLPAKEIHQPWKKGLGREAGYPEPIVDHATQSRKAIALFKSVR